MTDVKNKSMIGLFVLGAVALAVTTVFLLGSGMFFTKKVPLVLYFEGSVGGLTVGAPVVFRGVQIGQVTEIKIQASVKPLRFTIPVSVEVRDTAVEIKDAPNPDQDLSKTLHISREELYNELIKLGLRGELSQKSFVTGELQVMLDFFPDTKPIFRGDGQGVEVPTITSGLQKLAKSLESLPLSDLVSKIISVVDGMDAIVNSKKMQEVPDNLDGLLVEAKGLVATLGNDVAPVVSRLEETLDRYKDLAAHVDEKVDPLADGYTQLAAQLNAGAGPAMEKLDKALDQAKETLAKLEKTVGSDSPTVVELRKALTDVSAMARSIKAFADFLDRHPEALIQGKGPRR